eukprot:CAMPEP_0173414526 /NCGR_PEP_ID=MMETSP1356-20130122/84372_1 /TAXON_ID=77927 ORGANISM="Hemiselmis virescens, Strain PCC157" /NCGR_SAMPLE_ID=MMETSP1356 /ASSEMBLY_ACC=CAM_ASM_000847 /LENGTH=173 /DNA_ID=CAMNT_0014376713 /DNA_START=158 /DNA_END=680 /DNA_ORIENTATION=-
MRFVYIPMRSYALHTISLSYGVKLSGWDHVEEEREAQLPHLLFSPQFDPTEDSEQGGMHTARFLGTSPDGIMLKKNARHNCLTYSSPRNLIQQKTQNRACTLRVFSRTLLDAAPARVGRMRSPGLEMRADVTCVQPGMVLISTSLLPPPGAIPVAVASTARPRMCQYMRLARH